MSQQDRLGPQLPLALRYPPDQRFETWVGMPLALARLQALAIGEGSDALYVQGGNGSGKTHLLLAACAAAEAEGRRANYLSLARVRGHARDALQGIEQAALVALDDLDTIAGSREDEIALFDLHNRVQGN
jgi:DnaA family protein